MRYFAYGSNMLTRRLQVRVPSAQPIGTATLQGHVLRWHKRGADGSGKCDAFSTGDPGARVIGVVFEIPAREKPALDAAEGVGKGYREASVVVALESARLDVFTYLAEDTHIDPPLKPYDWYKALVVAGAREHVLPAAYVAGLEAQAALPDRNSLRARRAWSLLGTAKDP